MSESSQEDLPAERAVKFQADLPVRVAGDLDYVSRIYRPLGTTKKETLSHATERLLKFALEAVDPSTGDLPQVHPVSGRNRDDYLDKYESVAVKARKLR